MGYGESVKKGFREMFLNQAAMTDLANDPSATGHGFLTLVIAGLIYALIFTVLTTITLGALGFMAGIFTVITAPLAVIVGFFIGYSVFHLFAKMFGGQATGMQFFRAMANAMVIMWPLYVLMLVPIIGVILDVMISVWLIVVVIVAVKTVHKLSTGRAVMAVLIPAIVILAVVILLVGTAVLLRSTTV